MSCSPTQGRNREGAGVLRAAHLRALTESPHLINLLAQLRGRVAGGAPGGEGAEQGEDEEEDNGDEEGGQRVQCRVN